MNLPVEFLNRMRELLNDEYDNFLKCFEMEHHRGLRVNTLKTDVEHFKKISPFNIEHIPWCKEGFYLNDIDESKPGKHPYYHCGIYYIQEPSAMIPVEVLDPKPGDKVLDISAAPGGKSTQIGAKLNGEGLLVANDISPKRVKALTKNIEVFGISNSVITNDTPENLSYKFESYFDKILVDAPCSGEGMFRRDPKGVKSWSNFSIDHCSMLQKEILRWVPKMLKPGGKLVYSTCTFSPEENEGTIEWFLKENPEFKLEEIKNIKGLDSGKPQWIGGREELKKTLRVWPHKARGEGHFIALLKKCDGDENNSIKPFKINKNNVESFYEFSTEYLNTSLSGELHLIGNRLFLIPKSLPDISGIKIVNNGVLLGEINKNKFQPSQAFAMILKKDQFKNVLNLASDSIEAIKYLKGETLLFDGKNGWRLVCIDGFTVGWGKQTNDYLKNQYRTEWRMV